MAFSAAPYMPLPRKKNKKKKQKKKKIKTTTQFLNILARWLIV